VHVLLVNQYYPPDRAATATMAAAAAGTLVARGHAVTVLAGRPSYDVAQRTRWRPVRVETAHGVRVVRVGSTAFDRQRVAARLSNYLSYAALTAPLAVGARADVVIGMSDPPFGAVMTQQAARLRHRPFVYWLQDMHPEFGVATGDLRPGRIVERWQRMHRGALSRAAAVVVLGDDMARRAADAGADSDRISVVRSGADLPAPAGNPDTEGIVARIRGDRDFVVVHAGNLGQAVAWRALIDGVRDADARLVFVGSGAERAAAQKATAGDDHVAFFDYWPEAQAPHVFAAGDLHAVTVRRGLEGLVVPSRFYAVLAAGRPVLAVADDASDIAVLVRRHECGLVADPDDPRTVAQAIAWARSHPPELREMGERARAAARTYERTRFLHELVDIVESVRG
jgi:colanic acid biosynthesis glycosyl transferase WcaI